MAKEWRRCNICEQDFLIEGNTCPNHTGHFLVPTGRAVEEEGSPAMEAEDTGSAPPAEISPDPSPDAKVEEPSVGEGAPGKEGD